MQINVRFYNVEDAKKAAEELEAISQSGVYATFEVDEFLFGGERRASDQLIKDIEATGIEWRDFDY